jgi:hypothetical protein
MRPALYIFAILAVAALTWIACSEDDPVGTTGDMDPPGLATVTGWDKYHVVILFDEPVARETTDDPANYTIGTHHGVRAVMLEDSLRAIDVRAAALHPDNRTVTLTTDSLSSNNYSLIVGGISDTHGNRMRKRFEWVFRGNDAADTTPPEVAYQIPQSGATGVSTGTLVAVGFTEPVALLDVTSGLDVTGNGVQMVSIRSDDFLNYVCDLEPLQPNTHYTVSLVGIHDRSGNAMPDKTWSFDTEKTNDTTPPRLVATNPDHLAVDVTATGIVSFTFSEPMDPFSVRVRPPFDFSTRRWANGYKKLIYEGPWAPQTQYTLQIRPAEMRDPNGNTGKLCTLTFTTGSTITSGGFSGTITGDPNSADANNPQGGLVFAGPLSAYDIFTSVVTQVGQGGAYTIPHLPAKTYFPFYIMDSNHDRLYQPGFGDAIGIYGVNLLESDPPQAVTVSSTVISGINFKIHDPSAIYGELAYGGRYGGFMYVGLFATENFDPATSTPVLSVLADAPGLWDYVINSLETPIPPGTYYVAAFLDTNENHAFDYGLDPLGVYGGDAPIAVDLSHGKDASNANFELKDPVTPANGSSVSWHITVPSRRLKPFLDAVDPSSPAERTLISND